MSRLELFKDIVSVIEKTLLPLKEKVILMYHGSADDVIDVNESIQVYDKLKILIQKI